MNPSPPPTEPQKPGEIPLAELLERLRTSPDGLSQAEALKRLEQYGYNELVEKGISPWLKLLSYFWGPIPWMIEIAAILSALVQHWPDFAIIMVLLIVNAVVGFWEEYQAGNAIAALKANLALQAHVRRDGTWTTQPARQLASGDIIRLRLGDVVPADARLLEGDPLEIDQSALTGESLPVTREPGETVTQDLWSSLGKSMPSSTPPARPPFLARQFS